MLLSRTLLKRHSVLPGFDLALGFTLLYLSFIVLIPLSAAFLKTFTMTWPAFWDAVASPRVVASYRLTFGASFAAALLNVVAGLVVAWVLVRYEFPGRRIVDALVDLPFALPTAVAGIALTALYAKNGWIGALLPFKVSYTPLGVFVALTFIGLPFVVRTVQPVLEDLQREVEEAAATLGADRWQTFSRVILPAVAHGNSLRRRITAWSAGCSSGEEAYTAAILIQESGLFSGWNVRIAGTDLSQERIEHARNIATHHAQAVQPHHACRHQ